MQFDLSIIHSVLLMVSVVCLFDSCAVAEKTPEKATSSLFSPAFDRNIVDLEEVPDLSSNPEYAPGYRMEKRADGKSRPQKYGPGYRGIGIGKRESKYSPSYRYIGIGKREPDSPAKPKYSPGYRYIGIGKRMAPYWSSHLLANFKDVFGENEKSKTLPSQRGIMRPVYSVVSKKLTLDDEEPGTIFSAEDLPVTPAPAPVTEGRPNARGGYYEPIYRYVGIGR